MPTTDAGQPTRCVRIRHPAGSVVQCHLDGELGQVRQELVQRWVQQTYDDREPVHRPQDLEEVRVRQLFDVCEGGCAVGLVTQDHALDQNGPLAEQHVLGAAQADALGTQPPGPQRVGGGLGIGADADGPSVVGVRKKLKHRGRKRTGNGLRLLRRLSTGSVIGVHLEQLGDLALPDRECATIDLARGPIDRDGVAFVDRTSGAHRGAGVEVDHQPVDAGDTGASDATRDHGGVRGTSATRGNDGHRRQHAPDVVSAGLGAHEHHLPSLSSLCHGCLRVEHGLAHGRTRTGCKAGRKQMLTGVRHEPWVQKALELIPVDPSQGFVKVDEPLLDQSARDREGCGGAALANPCLQDPQRAVLDGELHVAQVGVMPFQGAQVTHQLLVDRRCPVRELLQGERRATAVDNILALGVGKVVPVDA